MIKMKTLIIDTDVGTDCDDLFALAYALKNPRIKVKAIRTVHGNTEVRAKIARKLERIIGITIPILLGEKLTLDGNMDYWTGIESKALTKDELKEPILNRKNLVYEPNDRLVCIGPLTNVALDIKNNKSIENIKKVYIMGSTPESHNFKADPKALNYVLLENWESYQITKPVSLKIAFTKPELKELKGNELGDFLYDSAMRWLDYTGKNLVPMYDVLAISAAAGEEFVKFKRQAGRYVSYDVDINLKHKLIECTRK